eukprot:875680-Rhodomonas_salina.3
MGWTDGEGEGAGQEGGRGKGGKTPCRQGGRRNQCVQSKCNGAAHGHGCQRRSDRGGPRGVYGMQIEQRKRVEWDARARDGTRHARWREEEEG